MLQQASVGCFRKRQDDLNKYIKNIRPKTLTLLLASIIIFAGLSCDNHSGEIYVSDAMINYTDPAVDGCGWTITINDEDFHPVNLKEEFRVDGTSVSVKYWILSASWKCPSWRNYPMRQIEIKSIEAIDN